MSGLKKRTVGTNHPVKMPKIVYINGLNHQSVGIVIRDTEGRILMMDRSNPPFGWACPAGHVDEGESPEEAVVREVFEETGITINQEYLILRIHEFVPWNTCVYGVRGHEWFVFEYKIPLDDSERRLIRPSTEAKNIRWVSKPELFRLNIEPVWRIWLARLGFFDYKKK